MIPGQNQSWVSEFILLGFSSDPTTNSILFIVFLLIYLSSVMGNGLIILLICMDTQLHTPMYFFLCILAMLDICWLQMYMFGALGITECTLFVVMAYDRYVAICYPLHYTVILNWGLCIRLASGSLVCGFLPNEINHFFCEIPAVLKLACADTSLNDEVDFILGFILLLIPLSLILASYVRIFIAVLRIRSTQGQMKAFSTCASHITVVTMFCIPCMVMYMRPGSEASPEDDKKLALFYNVISAFLNPIIYSLRNKDVKKAFLKLIGRSEDTQ
ncbi:Olfactory receptor 2A5 [Lemmus lemmus]